MAIQHGVRVILYIYICAVQARSVAKQSLLKEGRRNSNAMLSDTSFRRSSGTSEKLQGILKNFRRASAEQVAPRPLGRFENGADRMPAAVTSRQAPISPPLGPRARSHPSRGVAQAALSSRTGW